MKTTILSVLLAFMFAAMVTIRSYAAQPEISYTFKTGLATEYLGSVGAVFYEDPISVNELSVGYGNWYGGFWSSTGLGGTKYGETFGDEIDFYAGWAHTFGWVKVDLMSSYYAIASLDRTNDDLFALEAEISLPKFPFVEPYVRVRYLGDVGALSPKPGFFLFGGVRKYLTFGQGAADRSYGLLFQLSTAYAAGALRDSTGFVYGRFTSALDIPLSKRWTLTPSFLFQAVTPGQRNDPYGFTHSNETVFRIDLKWNF